MNKLLTAVIAASVLVIATPANAAVPPTPPPSDFNAGAVNRFFPIVPNTTNKFEGAIDGVPAREVFTVTNNTKVIQGVTTNVIRDSLFLHKEKGRGFYLAEFTLDWYATANDGTVWYFGEDTTEYDESGAVLSTDGSWQAGVNGAKAGVFMAATPVIGEVIQQESAFDAQDLFKVVAIRPDSIVTHEWTPLEPGLVTKKVFKANVGMTVEDTIKGAAIEDLLLTLDD